MPTGFRKSFLGFNCDDVIEYIESSHKEFSEKETVLREKNEELNRRLDSVLGELENAKQREAELETQLKYYTDKYDEINRLSQNIGKLYLVAQSSAQTVIKNAEQNRADSVREVEKNLNSISGAHDSLEALKSHLNETADNFSREIEQILSSLSDTRQKIESRNNNSSETLSNNQSLVSELSK